MSPRPLAECLIALLLFSAPIAASEIDVRLVEAARRGNEAAVGSIKYRDYASYINESGQHLIEIINDVLDLSKIESGVVELHEENFEISAVIRSTCTMVQGRAERKGVELELECPDGLPALRGDKRMLKQILVNLLSNAIKFTDAGGKVTFRVRCRAEGGHVFEIADSGIGIAPEDIPKALATFGQVDSQLSRKFEGTGLGLPLTKALVEMHGGSVDIQSKVGVGTTVTVRFPAGRIVVAKTGATPATGLLPAG